MSEPVFVMGMFVLFGGFSVTMIWKFADLLLDGKEVSQSNQLVSAALPGLNLIVTAVLILAAWRLQVAVFAVYSLACPQWVPEFYPPVAVVLLGMGALHLRKHRRQPSRRSLIFMILAALTVVLPACWFVLVLVALATIRAAGL